METSLAWNENFPSGYGHTSIAYLKRCTGFQEAKNGNHSAAQFVVNQCIKRDRIHKLRERFPKSILLPILGNNQLPLAIAEEIGLPIWYGVYIVINTQRKLLCAMQRLLNKPEFIGYVESDIDYILVDDVVTQGGTIAALREFVVFRGGRVVAVVALAYSIGSYAISPTRFQMLRLFLKFGSSLLWLLKMHNIVTEIYQLTYSQVRYLLRFANVSNIEKRMMKALA